MEATKTKPVVILMADDDDDDFLLTKKALGESRLLNDLYRVNNGEELLDYLHQRSGYTQANAPRPGIILLDLNMPKMDGREALREIKQDEKLRNIPVVVFTTSKAGEDVFKSYQLGVNSFITKPVTFDNLTEVMLALGNYWFEIVELPMQDESEPS